MQLRAGLRAWWIDVEKVRTERRGIGRLFGFALCILRLATPTEWVHLLLGTKERPLYSFTDAYVVGVLTVSAIIYLFPSVLLAGISTYFSATTLVVLLNIVLLEWAYMRAPLVICFSNALSRRSKIAPSCSNLLKPRHCSNADSTSWVRDNLRREIYGVLGWRLSYVPH
jgi:hypothetical protein